VTPSTPAAPAPSMGDAVEAFNGLQNVIRQLAERVNKLETSTEWVTTSADQAPQTSTQATAVTSSGPAEAPLGYSISSTAPTVPNDKPQSTELLLDAAAKARLQEQLAALGFGGESDSDTDDDVIKRKGKKSGKLRTAEHYVKRKIDWPHFHVYKGTDHTAATYDALSVEEFNYGYLLQMQKTRDETKDYMMNHLIHLMQDSMIYPWPAVRTFHGILLNRMELGEMSWGDTEKIQELRRQYVWHTARPVFTKTATISPCTAFQQGGCTRTDHPQSHFCAYCMQQAGKECSHAERNCKRKATNLARQGKMILGNSN